jgi:hypothetical protein
MVEAGTTYNIVVQAPDVLPGPLRPWFVRAFHAGDQTPIATAEHHDLKLAADEVFERLREHIEERMGRDAHFGLGDAPHGGAGFKEYTLDDHDEILQREELPVWCARVNELVLADPLLNAHQLRNMHGEFAFSPGSCPLCKALADIEVQVRDEILGARHG